MGAGASSVVGQEGDGGAVPLTGFGDLPEGCVAAVMARLAPTEICRLARLSRVFGAAAASDFVWEAKLPPNYGFLLEKATGGAAAVSPLRRKEIYARLCRPNFFDGGSKVFWLDKYSGGVCMLISAKALSITGIDDRRYWNHIQTEESRTQLCMHARSSMKRMPGLWLLLCLFEESLPIFLSLLPYLTPCL